MVTHDQNSFVTYHIGYLFNQTPLLTSHGVRNCHFQPNTQLYNQWSQFVSIITQLDNKALSSQVLM